MTYDVKLLLLHVICELFQQPKSTTEVPFQNHNNSHFTKLRAKRAVFDFKIEIKNMIVRIQKQDKTIIYKLKEYLRKE